MDTTQVVNIPKKRKNNRNVKQTGTKRRIMANKPRIVLREQVELNAVTSEIKKKTNPNQVEMGVIVEIIVTISGTKIPTKIRLNLMTNGAQGNLVVMVIQQTWNSYKHLTSI